MNLSEWCPIREVDIQDKTGIEHVKLLNDFVANGYGVINIEEKDYSTFYFPVEGIMEDKVKILFGIGTGLGVC